MLLGFVHKQAEHPTRYPSMPGRADIVHANTRCTSVDPQVKRALHESVEDSELDVVSIFRPELVWMRSRVYKGWADLAVYSS